MSEMVERVMDMLWARGVTVTVSDVEAVLALIQATPREMVGDYYADPDIGPSLVVG